MIPFVLNCLGAFEITLNTTPVTAFPTDKIRGLLTYLALEPAQPHRREQLAALFWPETAHPLALTNLRVALYRLRKTFDDIQPGSGAALISSTRQTIQLNPALITVDVLHFQTLLAITSNHLHQALQHCEACMARLTQAMVLYRGELLTGFGVDDAAAFEEWHLYQREMVQQQALRTLQKLADAYEAQTNYEQAFIQATRLVNLDPYREAAHGQLMRLLALRDLPNQALAQFATLRQLLREELDVEPAAASVALYEQIRAGKFGKEQGRQGDGSTERSTERVHPVGSLRSHRSQGAKKTRRLGERSSPCPVTLSTLQPLTLSGVECGTGRDQTLRS